MTITIKEFLELIWSLSEDGTCSEMFFHFHGRLLKVTVISADGIGVTSVYEFDGDNSRHEDRVFEIDSYNLGKISELIYDCFDGEEDYWHQDISFIFKGKHELKVEVNSEEIYVDIRTVDLKEIERETFETIALIDPNNWGELVELAWLGIETHESKLASLPKKNTKQTISLTTIGSSVFVAGGSDRLWFKTKYFNQLDDPESCALEIPFWAIIALGRAAFDCPLEIRFDPNSQRVALVNPLCQIVFDNQERSNSVFAVLLNQLVSLGLPCYESLPKFKDRYEQDWYEITKNSRISAVLWQDCRNLFNKCAIASYSFAEDTFISFAEDNLTLLVAAQTVDRSFDSTVRFAGRLEVDYEYIPALFPTFSVEERQAAWERRTDFTTHWFNSLTTIEDFLLLKTYKNNLKLLEAMALGGNPQDRLAPLSLSARSRLSAENIERLDSFNRGSILDFEFDLQNAFGDTWGGQIPLYYTERYLIPEEITDFEKSAVEIHNAIDEALDEKRYLQPRVSLP